MTVFVVYVGLPESEVYSTRAQLKNITSSPTQINRLLLFV